MKPILKLIKGVDLNLLKKVSANRISDQEFATFGLFYNQFLDELVKLFGKYQLANNPDRSTYNVLVDLIAAKQIRDAELIQKLKMLSNYLAEDLTQRTSSAFWDPAEYRAIMANFDNLVQVDATPELAPDETIMKLRNAGAMLGVLTSTVEIIAKHTNLVLVYNTLFDFFTRIRDIGNQDHSFEKKEAEFIFVLTQLGEFLQRKFPHASSNAIAKLLEKHFPGEFRMNIDALVPLAATARKAVETTSLRGNFNRGLICFAALTDEPGAAVKFHEKIRKHKCSPVDVLKARHFIVDDLVPNTPARLQIDRVIQGVRKKGLAMAHLPVRNAALDFAEKYQNAANNFFKNPAKKPGDYQVLLKLEHNPEIAEKKAIMEQNRGYSVLRAMRKVFWVVTFALIVFPVAKGIYSYATTGRFTVFCDKTKTLGKALQVSDTVKKYINKVTYKK